MHPHLEDDCTLCFGGFLCSLDDILLGDTVITSIILCTYINTQLIGSHSTIRCRLHLLHMQEGNAFIRVSQHSHLEEAHNLCLTHTTGCFDEGQATLDQATALFVDTSMTRWDIAVGVLLADSLVNCIIRTEEVVWCVALWFDCCPLECITSTRHQELIGILILGHRDIPEVLGEGCIHNLCGSASCFIKLTSIHNLLEGGEILVVLLDELVTNAGTG